MTVLRLAFVILNVVAFATFVLALNAVSVQAAPNEGPTMRKTQRIWDRMASL